jgi:protease I
VACSNLRNPGCEGLTGLWRRFVKSAESHAAFVLACETDAFRCHLDITYPQTGRASTHLMREEGWSSEGKRRYPLVGGSRRHRWYAWSGAEMSRKILLVTGDGGDSYEVLYAYQRFLEARWEPVVAAPSRRRLNLLLYDREPGWSTYVERQGLNFDADVAITAVAAKDFAGLVILGGRAPEYLRNDPSVLSLLREFSRQNKCICALGHGVQLLTAAGLIEGKSVTAHEHVQIEVERSGGNYVFKPAVRDGKLITGQTWRSHPEFYREVFACLGEIARGAGF